VKGLFCFDGPMYKDVNGVYCNTTITSEMFKRYFHVVDELVVVIRTLHLDITYEEAKMKKVELENMTFVEIGNLNSPKGFLFERNKYKKIIETCVKESDLIFARMPSIISDMTLDIAKKYKKKYLVEVGGCAWDAYWNHSWIGKLVAPYMYFNEKRHIKNADFSIYVTKRWLQSRYPSRGIQATASNVYLKNVKKNVLEKRIEKIKQKKEETFVIGTTAAINVKYKGQQYVIQAISNLNNKGYNFRYELVGGGEEKYLKKVASNFNVENNIQFKGLMLQEDVMDWLESIDMYIQPSKQEGLPRALVEALSMACPAMGSTTAGIPELLQRENIFSNESVDEIEEILIKYHNSKDMLINNAKLNYEKSKEFQLEKLNDSRNKIYEQYKEVLLKEKSVVFEDQGGAKKYGENIK